MFPIFKSPLKCYIHRILEQRVTFMQCKTKKPPKHSAFCMFYCISYLMQDTWVGHFPNFVNPEKKLKLYFHSVSVCCCPRFARLELLPNLLELSAFHQPLILQDLGWISMTCNLSKLQPHQGFPKFFYNFERGQLKWQKS